MKRLGLIGGMSWESTAVYYRRLNELARERLGGTHSADLVMISFDFAPIVAMQSAGAWDEAAELMVEAARELEAAGAEALVICANTMHRMAGEVAASVGIPLIHIAEATATAIRQARVRRPLLLATRFTMEQMFYREALQDRGVTAIIPVAAERARLHAIIYDELIRGRIEPASRAALVDMVRRAAAEDRVDGAILGCTELGLLVGPADLPIQIFDTTDLHVRAAMDFALGRETPRPFSAAGLAQGSARTPKA